MKTLKELKKFTLELTNVSSLATLQKELLEYCEIGEDDSDFVEEVMDELHKSKVENGVLKDDIVVHKAEVKRLHSELDKWPKKDKPKDKPEDKPSAS